MEFKTVKIDKVYSHFMCGKFVPFVHIGWSIYPITYNGSKYVINIEARIKQVGNGVESTTVYIINEYNENKKLFTKHRGKKYGAGIVPLIEIDSDKYLDIENMFTKEITLYLQEIIKCIFNDFKKWQEIKIKENEKMIKSQEWDGIIK